MNQNLQAALEYGARGWRVIPCHFVRSGRCSCNNRDCPSPGKHPMTPRGVTDARSSEEQIRAWWTTAPNANVAIATGRESGLTVVDIDPRSGGDDSWREILAAVGQQPETPEVLTGGGGRHIYLQYDERFGNGALGDKGIDIKGEGGYVLAAPSNHISGGVYAWEISSHPDDVPVASWPALVEHLRGSESNGGQFERIARADLASDKPIPYGQRNSHLYLMAARLRSMGMGQDEILDVITRHNKRCLGESGQAEPLSTLEVERIAKGVMRYEPDAPPVSTIDDSGQPIKPTEQPPVGLPYTDLGNRDRLINKFGAQILHCHELGWLLWDGRRWTPDKMQRLQEMAHKVARDIRAEESEYNEKGQDLARKWSLASENQAKIKAMVAAAASHPSISVAAAALDTHPYLFNCTNVTLDLLNGCEPIDHDPAHRLTTVSNMAYRPLAECQLWRDFVDEILVVPAVVRHFQKILGCILTGDMTPEAFTILFGEGANGKSIALEVLGYLLGDYWGTAKSDTFIDKVFNGPRYELAMLAKVRGVSVSETNEGEVLDEALVKRVVSGDAETARMLYKEPFTYRPQYKILLATNNKPRIKGVSHGTWRRIHLIEFPVKFGEPGFPPAKNKAQLVADLKAESSGILNWLIEGYQLYRAEGLEKPPEMVESAQDYRMESDPFDEFLQDFCVLSDDAQVALSDLVEVYNAVNKDSINHIHMGRQLTKRNFKRRRIGQTGTRVVVKIGLNATGQQYLSRFNRGQ